LNYISFTTIQQSVYISGKSLQRQIETMAKTHLMYCTTLTVVCVKDDFTLATLSKHKIIINTFTKKLEK